MDAAVEGLCAKYRGHELIRRLEFLAGAAPAIAGQAIAAAAAAAKAHTTDTATYRRLAGTGTDGAWVEATERAALLKQSQMEKELALLSSNQMRDSIRATFIDLAAFCLERGDLGGAVRAWTRACEFCSNSKQLAEAHLALAELSVCTGQLGSVSVHAGRLAGNAAVLQEATAARLHVCTGLAALQQSDFASAAAAFLAVPIAQCSTAAAAAAPGGAALQLHVEDLGVYAALAAAASLSREELQAAFLGPAARGKALLEQAPALREVIVALVACRYSAALGALRALAPVLAVDPYLQPLLDGFMLLTRRRCIEQYVLPYSTVDIAAMAAVFSLSVDDLERELVQLIRSGGVHMRIDTLRHTLCAPLAAPRTAAFDRVCRLARDFECDARTALLRVSMERQGMLVKLDPMTAAQAAAGLGGGSLAGSNVGAGSASGASAE